MKGEHELLIAAQEASRQLEPITRLLLKLPDSTFKKIGAEINAACNAKDVLDAAIAKVTK